MKNHVVLKKSLPVFFFLIVILGINSCSGIDNSILYKSSQFTINSLKQNNLLVFGATLDRIGVPSKYRNKVNQLLLASQLHKLISRNRSDLILTAQSKVLTWYNEKEYFKILKEFQQNQSFEDNNIFQKIKKNAPEVNHLIFFDIEELNEKKNKTVNSDTQKDIMNKDIEKVTTTETYQSTLSTKIFFSIYNLSTNKIVFKTRSIGSLTNSNQDQDVEIIDRSEDKGNFGEQLINSFLNNMINDDNSAKKNITSISYPKAPGLFKVSQNIFTHFAREVLPK